MVIANTNRRVIGSDNPVCAMPSSPALPEALWQSSSLHHYWQFGRLLPLHPD
jgi:hypothetical protein